MQRELRYTDTALADLEAIADWLAQPGAGPVAWQCLTAIWGAIERLRDDPCRYPIGPHAGVRELPCRGGYRAMYRVHPDTGRNETAGDVVVLKIYGPGQSREGLGRG